MGRLRTFLVLLAFLLLGSQLYAVSFSGSISYCLQLPEESHVAYATGILEEPLSERMSLGAYLGGGYSLRHYREGLSEALVYGPALEAGLEFRKDYQKLSLTLEAGAKAIYAQFPTVLWYSVDVGLLLPLGEERSLVVSSGILFWEDKRSLGLGLGVRL